MYSENFPLLPKLFHEFVWILCMYRNDGLWIEKFKESFHTLHIAMSTSV